MKIKSVFLTLITALLLLTASCDPPPPGTAIVLKNPMAGNENQHWTINNYVDVGNGLDYMGNSRFYAAGHNGTDFDVASFRQMDFGYMIRAAADGQVVAAVKNNFDRNITCTGNPNYVILSHDGGWQTLYYHLQSNNTLVNVGDMVQAGDPIGIVGSSGCSTQPHLHFEVKNPGGQVVCPFAEHLWETSPAYNSPVRLMDTILVDGGIDGGDNGREYKDPPRYNDTTGGLYRTFGFAIHLGGGTGTETITQSVFRPNGSLHQTVNRPPSDYGHRWWGLNFYPNQAGAWRCEVRINGVTVSSETVQIN